MTAIITITTEEGIQIYTDSAGYDPDGRMLMELQKCRASIRGPFAVVARGDGLLCEIAHDKLIQAGELGGFDVAVQMLPDVANFLANRAVEIGDFINVAVILAGWSVRHQGWKTYRVAAVGPSLAEMESGSAIAYEPSWFHVEPEVSMDDLRGIGLLTEDDGLKWRGHDSALNLMERLRQKPFTISPPAPAEGCIVGGALHAISLSDTGVTMEQVFRWPDEIGQRLGTALSEPM